LKEKDNKGGNGIKSISINKIRLNLNNQGGYPLRIISKILNHKTIKIRKRKKSLMEQAK